MDTSTTQVTIHSAGRQVVALLIALLAVLATAAPALAETSSAPRDSADGDGTVEMSVPILEVEVGASDDAGPTRIPGPDDLQVVPPDPGDGPVLKDPDDGPRIEIDPAPTFKPKLVLTPGCDPAGFSYGLGGPAVPEDAGVMIQWRKAPDGALHTVPTAAEGFVDSGQGHFQVRAVVLVGRQRVHRIDWTDVVVRCRTPRPTVTIDVAPTCDADGGIDYAIDSAPAPEGPSSYTAQWRVAGGDVHTVNGKVGSILTGEGTFEIRGVMHLPGPGLHASDVATVVVDCPDEVPDIPDDAPRPGIPTFTG